MAYKSLARFSKTITKSIWYPRLMFLTGWVIFAVGTFHPFDLRTTLCGIGLIVSAVFVHLDNLIEKLGERG